MKVQELLHQLTADYIDTDEEVIISVFGDINGHGYATIEKITSYGGRITIDVQAQEDPRTRDKARTEGYQQAIAMLRDDERYRNWWTSSGSIPDGPIRRHLADYLETIAATPESAGARTPARLARWDALWAGTWTPAQAGDTPGQLVPGEGDVAEEPT